MKAKYILNTTLAILAATLVACTTPGRPHDNAGEKGPHGTVAHYIDITASQPGARIEVDHETVGNAPMKLKIFGDKDGTFHRFHSDQWVVRAYPTEPGNTVQVKTFRTAVPFGIEDTIPKSLFFDFGPSTSKIQVNQSAP